MGVRDGGSPASRGGGGYPGCGEEERKLQPWEAVPRAWCRGSESSGEGDATVWGVAEGVSLGGGGVQDHGSEGLDRQPTRRPPGTWN